MKTKNIIYAFRRARAQMKPRLVLPWQPAHAQFNAFINNIVRVKIFAVTCCSGDFKTYW